LIIYNGTGPYRTALFYVNLHIAICKKGYEGREEHGGRDGEKEGDKKGKDWGRDDMPTCGLC